MAGHQEGQGDAPEAPPGRGAVDHACFMVFGRDALQGREEDGHGVAGRPPDFTEVEDDKGRRPSTQPGDGGTAEARDELVGESRLGIEDRREEEADHQGREHRRIEVDRAEQVARADGGVERKGEDKPEPGLAEGRDHREDEGVGEGHAIDLLGEHRREAPEARESEGLRVGAPVRERESEARR